MSPGQTGRYVRIWVNDTDYLNIAEVRVTGLS